PRNDVQRSEIRLNQTFNQRVSGSNPDGLTKENKHLDLNHAIYRNRYAHVMHTSVRLSSSEKREWPIEIAARWASLGIAIIWRKRPRTSAQPSGGRFVGPSYH